MRKGFKVVVGLLLAICLLSTAAFAASPTDTVVPQLTGTATGTGLTQGTPSERLTDSEADKVAGVADGTLHVIWCRDLAGTPPVDVTFTVAGYTYTMYIFHCGEGGWTLLDKGAGPSRTVTINEFSPFAIAVEVAHSPKTLENTLPYVALGVAMVAAAAAVVIRRKEEV